MDKNIESIFFSDPEYVAKLKLFNDKFCVYRIIHIPTCKFYFGSTSGLAYRVLKHISELKSGKHHNQKLLDTYTQIEDFVVGVQIYETKDEMRVAEQGYLDIHHGSDDCLNIGNSATSPWSVLPDYVREAIVKANTGRVSPTKGQSRSEVHRLNAAEGTRKALCGKPGHWLGRKFSEETRLKIALARSKPISVAGVVYPRGAVEVFEKLGITRKHIYKMINDESAEHADKFFCDSNGNKKE